MALYIGYTTYGGINVNLLVVPLVAFVVFSSSSSSYHESSSGLFFSHKRPHPEIHEQTSAFFMPLNANVIANFIFVFTILEVPLNAEYSSLTK